MMEKAIIAKNITKKYKLYNGTKERIFDLLTPASYGSDFHALRDVSFEAEKGDVVGFVGINGSGKSTLSNIIAGIVPETSGTVQVSGQTALIAVASGLKGDLSGRDNIELKCLMLGFNKEEIKELEPEIIEFSELGTFIDQPVKSYSSGMKSRLGFAISVSVDPDVLIIDEALSVGDKAFAEKSLKKMKEFKTMGKTMIFVSHSIGQMRKFCEKILWLEYGKVKDYGDVDEVIPKYEQFLKSWTKMSKKEREEYKDIAIKGKDATSLLENRELNVNKEYDVQLTSLLGHIKAGDSYIYDVVTRQKDGNPSEDYKNSVYYIKRQARYNGEMYFLLSDQPSGKSGLIGWIKADNISSHSYVVIDCDSKTFYMEGKGSGFSRPWGGKKNQVIEDLALYKDREFSVDQTVKVGNNLWFRGNIDEYQIWVHDSQLRPEEI